METSRSKVDHDAPLDPFESDLYCNPKSIVKLFFACRVSICPIRRMNPVDYGRFQRIAPDRNHRSFLGDLVWLHRFECEFLRFACKWASDSDFPSRRLSIDHCFQLAVAGMNRFRFAKDRKIWTKLANFEFFVGHAQMQFYIRGKSAVGFCNHVFSTNRATG